MRRSILLALAVSLVGCGGGDVVAGGDPAASRPGATAGLPASPQPPTTGSEPSVPDLPSTVPPNTAQLNTASPETTGPEVGATARLMAAALQRLVEDQEGFPGSPTTTFLVRQAIDRYAGVTGGDHDGEDTVDPAGGCCGRPLTDEERGAIERALTPAGAVQFIADPADWTDDLGPTVPGAVILGVGEPEITGGTALVPVSMWCGGLCGTWLSYRAELAPDGWRIVGPEGPIAVS